MSGANSRANVVPAGQRWYQAKRVPLYIMTAGGFVAAATYLLGNRMQVLTLPDSFELHGVSITSNRLEQLWQVDCLMGAASWCRSHISSKE